LKRHWIILEQACGYGVTNNIKISSSPLLPSVDKISKCETTITDNCSSNPELHDIDQIINFDATNATNAYCCMEPSHPRCLLHLAVLMGPTVPSHHPCADSRSRSIIGTNCLSTTNNANNQQVRYQDHPNFAPTDASQGSRDGTFPITKHHINLVIINVNLDNAI
jgi:hypothetical protein